MSRTKLVLPALVALWAWAGPANAAPDVLDLIPEDAAGALAIRNLAELHKKGDKFLDETEMKVSLRPSKLFELAFDYLGLTRGVDRNGAAAIVAANPVKAGHKGLSDSGLDILVAVVPFTDRDEMAANFDFAAGALKPDTLVKGSGKNRFGHFFYARGKHLFFGDNEKAVASVAKGKSAGAALSAAQRRQFAGCDILVHFGTEFWGEEWARFLDQTAGKLKDPEDAADRVARELLDSLRTLRFALGGIRLDGGLGVNLLAVFPEAKGPARKFLGDLAGGPGAAGLDGLPGGPAVFAQAGRGDGARNALVARLVVNFLLRDLLETNRLISAADRPTFAGVFTEVWKRLKGRRLAVYRNADEQKQGLFSVAAVLDTEDAEGFLKELRQLARFGGDALDLSPETGRKEDVEAVKKLVRELGDDAFAVRESATTKLALLGEPALPYVEPALKSDDAEVRRRADRVKRRIVAVAQERRKELLSQALPRPVRPTFAFAPQAETVEGCRVEVLRVKLAGGDAALAPRLRQLFGPGWNAVRLAPCGKQVAVLYGSDRKLLAETLRNLKEKRPGLAGAKYLAAFGKHSDPGRTAEFHASVATALALLKADDLRRAPAAADHAMTSFALTVGPNRLQLDLWVPNSEVRVLAKQQPWW
jgi:hypothetical protein